MHQGNIVPVRGRYLSVSAWYMGGVDVVDFTDPANPVEVAYYDVAQACPTGSDNWSAYWYEGPVLERGSLTLYGTDGVSNPATGRGFQVFEADLSVRDANVDHLNPQTVE